MDAVTVTVQLERSLAAGARVQLAATGVNTSFATEEVTAAVPAGLDLVPTSISVTVQATVITCPTTDGFGACDVIVVVVLGRITVCVSADETLPLKSASPA